MSSYRGTADRPDQARAIAAVVAVHALLAFVILAGLNVTTVKRAVEQFTTININKPPTPPPVQHRKPSPRPKAEKNPAGRAAPKTEPTPFVAPPPKLAPLPSVPATPVAGKSDSLSSGAAAGGAGRGSAGAGGPAGAGGYGDYSRFTPARLVRNLGSSDYRAIAGNRMPRGAAMVSLVVQPDGTANSCRIMRSSGDAAIDGELCPLIIARLRFRPALDDQGRPIAYQLQYVATWTL